jgi:serine/threonine-protein kinase
MGAVYEGRHLGTGRRVAVKLIIGEATKNAEVVRRFQREAMASGAIESQHIAQVLDTGVDAASGRPYLVMELLNGGDLQGSLERLGQLAPDLALRIVAQACLGLQKAHEAQVVHRDIKPANLFLAKREGSEIVVKLLDFGIAKATGSDTLSGSGNHAMTRTGTMLGSPIYMSPEQAMGRKSADHRTDIWSLGVVLYEALCGRTPHGHAETIGELVIRICGEAPSPVQDHAPWVPPEVAAIAHKALALDPAARFQSAAEMYAAVRALLPMGHTLDESMFVALPAQVRAVAAPRWSVASDMRAPSPSFPQMSQSNPDMALLAQAQITASSLARVKNTADGFAQAEGSLAPVPKRSMGVWYALAVAAVLGVAGTAVVTLRGSHASAAAPPQGLVGSAVVAPPPVSAQAPPPTAPPVAPTVSAAPRQEPATELPSTPAPAKPAQSHGSRPSSSPSAASTHSAHSTPTPPPATAPAAPTPAAPTPTATATTKYNPLDHL